MAKVLIIKGANFFTNALDYSMIWSDITTNYVTNEMDYGYWGANSGETALDGRITTTNKISDISVEFVEKYYSNTSLINSDERTIRITIPNEYTIRLAACKNNFYNAKTAPSTCYRTDIISPSVTTIYTQSDVLPSLSGASYWGFNISKNDYESPLNVTDLLAAGFKVEELI